METKVSIFFSFLFFCFFFKFHNQLLSTSHSATCQAMISETLAAVEQFSKILDFFSTAAKGFLWMHKKWRTLLQQKNNITPLATVEHKSKILDFFRLLRLRNFESWLVFQACVCPGQLDSN